VAGFSRNNWRAYAGTSDRNGRNTQRTPPDHSARSRGSVATSAAGRPHNQIHVGNPTPAKLSKLADAIEQHSDRLQELAPDCAWRRVRAAVETLG
jgi:hypothetical protein